MIIDKYKALELLDAAVAAEGENKIVQVCNYFKEDGVTPNCIVGHALSQVGIKLDDLSYNNVLGEDASQSDEATTRRRTNGTGVTALSVDGVEITREAIHIFDAAQTVQDGRMHGVRDRTWGSAVKRAHQMNTYLEKDQE